MPFSKKLVECYQKIEKVTDTEKRVALMLELADIFVQDTDETDEHIGEEIHGLVNDVIDAHVKYERVGLSLARVLLRSLPGYMNDHPAGQDDTQPNTKVN